MPLEDIAVLTPAGREKSALRRRGSVDGFRLSETVEPGTVLSASVHAFKGLERPVVILAELGDGTEDLSSTCTWAGRGRGTTSSSWRPNPSRVSSAQQHGRHGAGRPGIRVTLVGDVRSRVLRTRQRELAGAPRGHGAVRRGARRADAGRASARDRRRARDRLLRAQPVEAAAAHADAHLHDHVRHEGPRPHAAADRINDVHARIHGVDPVTGLPYDALDPELLLYVHACLVDSALLFEELTVGRLDDAGRQRFHEEQMLAAELVRIPREIIPPTVPALRACLRDVRIAGSCRSRTRPAGSRRCSSTRPRRRVAAGPEGRLAAGVRHAAAGAPRAVRVEVGPAAARGRCRRRSPRPGRSARCCRPEFRYIAPYQEWRATRRPSGRSTPPAGSSASRG